MIEPRAVLTLMMLMFMQGSKYKKHGVGAPLKKNPASGGSGRCKRSVVGMGTTLFMSFKRTVASGESS